MEKQTTEPTQNELQKPHKPISWPFIVLLIAVAAFFDALSFIPVINIAVVAAGQLTLASLFYLAGINVFKNKPAILYYITTIVEAIPVASELPLFLIQTIALIVIYRRNAPKQGF